MNNIEWKKIENEFIECDAQGKFQAGQRQILDWFSERLVTDVKTLNNCWEDLVDKMKCYDKEVAVNLIANIDIKGKLTITCFILLGDFSNWKQTCIHNVNSIEELFQKAEAWAKIVTTKLDIETTDIAIN